MKVKYCGICCCQNCPEEKNMFEDVPLEQFLTQDAKDVCTCTHLQRVGEVLNCNTCTNPNCSIVKSKESIVDDELDEWSTHCNACGCELNESEQPNGECTACGLIREAHNNCVLPYELYNCDTCTNVDCYIVQSRKE